MAVETILDVMGVPAGGDPTVAVRRISIPARMAERDCDVLVVGGGTGGVAAAIAAARHGQQVVVLEETDWIGGQLTTQGISALDEHSHIETFGGTATYYRLREAIRDHYRSTYPAVRDTRELNPGRSWVTRLAFEPRVALAVIWDLLGTGRRKRPRVDLRTKIVKVEVEGDHVRGVVAFHLETGRYTRYTCKRIIDATEFGDVLDLAAVESVVGAEPRAVTGEAHARSSGACEDCVQSLTYPAALRLMPHGSGPATVAPPKYEHYRVRQPFGLRIHVTGGEVYSDQGGWLQYDLFDRLPGTKGGLWDYRRLVDRDLLGVPAEWDISIINWPGNDYRDLSPLRLDPGDQAHALQAAKWVSQGFVHWLQTEAAHPRRSLDLDVTLAPDVYDTADGLSKHPYIREGRRLVSTRTIVEHDVSAEENPGPASRRMVDSVGVGWYPIDIHAAHPEEQAVSLATKPFQIPLGALVPIRMTNLLAGAKNIGTTHITNGCFRLHPVEWNIGEAAGVAAAVSLERDAGVRALVGDPQLLNEIQMRLIVDGVPLDWVVDIGVDHPGFRAVQVAALSGSFDPREVNLQAQLLAPADRQRIGI